MFKRVFCLLSVLMLFGTGVTCSGAQETDVRLPVIMYHHINPAAEAWGKYVISPQTLERDFAYLHENGYTAVSAAELAAYCRGDMPLPEKRMQISRGQRVKNQ